jgi:hypothetical protein
MRNSYTRGTSRTCRDVRLESVVRTKAEVERHHDLAHAGNLLRCADRRCSVLGLIIGSVQLKCQTTQTRSLHLCQNPPRMRTTPPTNLTAPRDPWPDNLAAMRRALEEAGVEFIPAKSGKGVGVKLSDER